MSSQLSVLVRVKGFLKMDRKVVALLVRRRDIDIMVLCCLAASWHPIAFRNATRTCVEENRPSSLGRFEMISSLAVAFHMKKVSLIPRSRSASHYCEQWNIRGLGTGLESSHVQLC